MAAGAEGMAEPDRPFDYEKSQARPQQAVDTGMHGGISRIDRQQHHGGDAAGDGDWAVTLRCAQIDPDDPRHARVQAGCGLVADSDPRTELAESEAKLQAVWPVLGD